MADYNYDKWLWDNGILKGHEDHGCQWDQNGSARCPDDPDDLDPESENVAKFIDELEAKK